MAALGADGQFDDFEDEGKVEKRLVNVAYQTTSSKMKPTKRAHNLKVKGEGEVDDREDEQRVQPADGRDDPEGVVERVGLLTEELVRHVPRRGLHALLHLVARSRRPPTATIAHVADL